MSENIEEEIEHHSPPEVTVVFKGIIKPSPVKSIGKYDIDLPPGITEPLLDAVRYYMIDSEIVSERIEIRILALKSDLKDGQLHQWEGRDGWIDRTKDCLNVGKYKLIIGETTHLSGFGIR